jgi:hypothetical protein
MTTAELVEFEAEAGDLLDELGYLKPRKSLAAALRRMRL